MLRSLARGVAHKRMKDAGLVWLNKKNHGRSYFSMHWREVLQK